MILRGAFWMGLVWLCMTHGPHLGFGPSPALACGAACADPVAEASDSWRRSTLTRLAAVKIELNAAVAQRQDPLPAGAGKSESEAVRRFSDRLADAANRLSAP